MVYPGNEPIHILRPGARLGFLYSKQLGTRIGEITDGYSNGIWSNKTLLTHLLLT